jgi:hypothetical protein
MAARTARIRHISEHVRWRKSATVIATNQAADVLRHGWRDAAGTLAADIPEVAELLQARLEIAIASQRLDERHLLATIEEVESISSRAGSPASDELARRLRRTVYEYLLALDAARPTEKGAADVASPAPSAGPMVGVEEIAALGHGQLTNAGKQPEAPATLGQATTTPAAPAPAPAPRRRFALRLRRHHGAADTETERSLDALLDDDPFLTDEQAASDWQSAPAENGPADAAAAEAAAAEAAAAEAAAAEAEAAQAAAAEAAAAEAAAAEAAAAEAEAAQAAAAEAAAAEAAAAEAAAAQAAAAEAAAAEAAEAEAAAAEAAAAEAAEAEAAEAEAAAAEAAAADAAAAEAEAAEAEAAEAAAAEAAAAEAAAAEAAAEAAAAEAAAAEVAAQAAEAAAAEAAAAEAAAAEPDPLPVVSASEPSDSAASTFVAPKEGFHIPDERASTPGFSLDSDTPMTMPVFAADERAAAEADVADSAPGSPRGGDGSADTEFVPYQRRREDEAGAPSAAAPEQPDVSASPASPAASAAPAAPAPTPEAESAPAEEAAPQEVDPQAGSGEAQRGWSIRRQSRPGRAVPAVEIEDDPFQTNLQLADTRRRIEDRLRRKRCDEAAALLQELSRETGGRAVAELAMNAGDRCRALGKSNAALNCYLAAARSDPVFELPLSRLADICIDDKETDLAVSYLERIARLYRFRGDDKEAMRVYRRIATIAPYREDILALLLKAHRSGGFDT